MTTQVNYFFASGAILLLLIALLLVWAALTRALAHKLARSIPPPPNVSLLSPTLATELLGQEAARAWLLSVALDLHTRSLPSLPSHAPHLGRLARLKLIHMRDERDHEATPIADALAACCHACALHAQGTQGIDMEAFRAAQEAIEAATSER